MTVSMLVPLTLGLVIADDKVTDIIILIAGGAAALAAAVGWVVKRFLGERLPAAPRAKVVCEAELHAARLHTSLGERHEQTIREHSARVEAALVQLLEVERQEAMTLATIGPTMTLVSEVLGQMPGLMAANNETLRHVYAELNRMNDVNRLNGGVR